MTLKVHVLNFEVKTKKNYQKLLKLSPLKKILNIVITFVAVPVEKSITEKNVIRSIRSDQYFSDQNNEIRIFFMAFRLNYAVQKKRNFRKFSQKTLC